MRDLLIIGSGPAGLSASLYAKRAGLDVWVAEKEYLGTGQIAESSQVDNYIGLVGKSGYELGEAFRQDAEKLGVEFYEGRAVRLIPQDGCWITEFADGKTIKSKSVIYAAGAKHRRLHIPGEDRLIGKGISFCVLCDGAFYQDKTVAVIGGGDTALDYAVYLADIAEKVYLIHRGNAFRGLSRNVFRVKEKANIEIILAAKAAEFIGESELEGIVLADGSRLETAGAFIAAGMEPQSELLRDIVAVDEQGYVAADETGTTEADVLFVAGDVRRKKLRQVITAAADGANAAVSAFEYLKKLSQ